MLTSLHTNKHTNTILLYDTKYKETCFMIFTKRLRIPREYRSNGSCVQLVVSQS